MSQAPRPPGPLLRSTERKEEIEEEEEVKAVEFVASAKALKNVPYEEQGDPYVNTPQALATRANNRYESTVIAVLQAFWDSVVTERRGQVGERVLRPDGTWWGAASLEARAARDPSGRLGRTRSKPSRSNGALRFACVLLPRHRSIHSGILRRSLRLTASIEGADPLARTDASRASLRGVSTRPDATRASHAATPDAAPRAITRPDPDAIATSAARPPSVGRPPPVDPRGASHPPPNKDGGRR